MIGAERVALVEAVMLFLDEWQGLLKDLRRLMPERSSSMLERAEQLRAQADLAGQGAIVHHLDVCIECLNAPALDRRGFQEALRNLSEVTWQLKQELGPLARRAPSAASVGARSLLPPPLLADAASGAALPRMGASAAGGRDIEPPPPISLPGTPRPEPAPELGHSPASHSPASLAQPPLLDRSRLAAPEAAPAAPLPDFVVAPPRAPSIIPGAGGRKAPAPAAPSAPAPGPPILAGSHAPAARAKDKPNLLVATMFGLRAFGRGKGASPAAPAPAPAPGAVPRGAPKGGVLGLGQRSRGSAASEPAWIGPRAGGLPELATGPSSPPLDRAAGDFDERLRQLRGDAPRPDRHGSDRAAGRDDFERHGAERSSRSGSGRPASRRPSTPPGAHRGRGAASSGSNGVLREPERPRARDGSSPVPWWIGAVAVALVGLVVVLLLVFGRSSPNAIATAGPVQPAPGDEPELPTSRLLDDKERMRALMSLVHGHGGEESPELADLLNEEGALVYEVLERSCDQPGDKCESPAPIIAGTVRSGPTPQHEIRDLFTDRKIESQSRAGAGQVSKWLAGLSTPAIGAQDDPNVRRWVEYYTSNQVGREEFQNMLFRCGAYQDLIEKTLVHYGMPRALLALVMTESGCVPHAQSPVGALGLWQFMPATARAYHLHVKENVVDERLSPPKSTEAAVKFLADLYRKMGSWEFALASYNMGPFGLSARIRRAGGNVTFWDLADAGALPDETARYVPRIQAYALILENLGRFNFSTAQMRATEVTAELEAPPGTRLGMLARAASTSLDHLKLLNPDIVGSVVPDLPGSPFMVQVPKEEVFRARSLLEQLLADGNESDRCVSSAFDWGSERFSEKMCDTGTTGRRR